MAGSPSPALALPSRRMRLHPAPREEELEEADAAVLAGLVDAQQDEVVGEPFLSHLAIGDLAVVGERLDRVLGVVVVPGHAVWSRNVKSLPSFLRSRFW